ncbi:MAG: hypothetical protein HFJ91_00650 [Muribaculaceae bacterium]|nr:hypothetical protein [Muribaculaceae bacterium]
MTETKQFFFPDAGASSGNMLASILPALQNRGIDTAALMGMMGNNGGLFGGRGIEDIIALVVVAAIFGNGNFGFGGNNGNGRGDTERQMLMDAIQRNGIDISQLASTLNCSIGQLNSGITSVAQQICNLSAQSGQNTASIIAQMQQGNMALTQQICNCCCDIKSLIAQGSADNRLAICQQTNAIQNDFQATNRGIERGFAEIGYTLRDQTCNLEKNTDVNTRAVLAKLDAIEDSRKDRELAEKDRIIATLTARSERQAELQPIYSALQEIQCNQPPVKKICCPDQYVPVNSSINAMYGLIPTGYCGGVFGNAFSNPFGFGNGTGNFF